MIAAQPSLDRVTIAGLYDLKGFDWGEEIIDFTVRLINNHSDGWFDDVLIDTHLDYSISDAGCDHDVAVRAYLNLTRSGVPPNAILGCTCSSSTMAVSTLADIEEIPVLSPTATNPKLSNKDDYSTANRLVAPDDGSGQAGALVSLLREFGWDRISIINTDTSYAQDFRVELTRSWEGEQDGFKGEIAYAGTVQIDRTSGEVDPDSVQHVFRNIPVNDPSANSRVIVLLAHDDHAFPILKIAQEMKFQPDTIYIGVDAWAGAPLGFHRDPHTWMPDVPGYIGLVPYTNLTAPVYTDFLGRLHADQRRNGRNITTHLIHSAFRMVDSVLALASALSNVAPDQRQNGTAVVGALRSLKFEGVSGLVEFNEKGDWANPRYTVMALPRAGAEFVSVGTATPRGVDIDMNKICFPQIGCGVEPPSDKYPVPDDIWTVAVFVALGVLAAIVLILIPTAYRFHRQRLPLQERLKLLEEEIHGIDSHNSTHRRRKGSLYKEIAMLLDQPRPPTWTDHHGLVPILPTDKEYWTVFDKMRETTSDTVWITELSRVQNDGVFAYYVFRKNQLASKYGLNIDDTEELREIDAWHGTSSLNPDVVYNDNHDGFMMQYAQQGLYGRGLYFAERFEYSDCYSYRVNGATFPHGSARQECEDREIFLVKLLVGRAVTINQVENEEVCRSLVAAPENPNTEGLRYDTVSGFAIDQTKIHAVYENGRAYPTYLIRYYKGPRDPARTPFETQAEAVADSKMDATLTTVSSLDADTDDSGRNSARKVGSSNALLALLEAADELDGVVNDNSPAQLLPVDIEEECTRRQSGSSNAPGTVLRVADELGDATGTMHVLPGDSEDDGNRRQSGSSNTPGALLGVADELGNHEGPVQLLPADIEGGMPDASTDSLWLYEGDEGEPVPFSEELQAEIESAYRVNPRRSFTIDNSLWTYDVDLSTMTQTNLDHPAHRRRSIRRLELR